MLVHFDLYEPALNYIKLCWATLVSINLDWSVLIYIYIYNRLYMYVIIEFGRLGCKHVIYLGDVYVL